MKSVDSAAVDSAAAAAALCRKLTTAARAEGHGTEATFVLSEPAVDFGFSSVLVYANTTVLRMIQSES